MANSFDVGVRIRLFDAFSAPLKRMGDQLKGIKAQFSQVSGAFKLAADMRLAADSVGSVGNAIMGSLKPAFDEFKAFESQLSELAAISGEIGTKSFAELKKQAADLGAATSYSGTEAAAAMTELARAGRNATEIMAITPTVLSLARASGKGLADTAEILGSSMAGLGLDASQATKAADVLAKTFTSSATSLGDLGEAFKMTAPTAKAANINIEQLSTAIGVLGNAGIRGTMAGTGLQGTILGIIAPSKMSAKYLGEIGFKGQKLKEIQKTLASGDLSKAIGQIGQATAKLPDEKKLRILEGIFGREALKSANVLIDAKMDTGIKGWDQLQAKVEKASGTASRMAFVMEDNLAGELERMGGAISGLALQIGEMLKPAIVDVAGKVGILVANVAEWINKNPEMANSLVRMTILVGGAAIAIKGVTLTLAALTTTYGLAKGAYLAVKGALIITTGATNATAAAMYTRLIPSFLAARVSAIATSATFMRMSSTTLGKAGLLGAAAALGYTIGRLISNWLDLDKHLSNTIAWITGVNINHEKTDKRGLEAGGDQVFGDGTVLDGKTGLVKKLGTGPAHLAPKAVREGRAAGAMTMEAINARVTAKTAPMGPPAPPGAGGDPATKEQTKVLEQHNREQTKELKRMREALERRVRGTTGGSAPAAAGSGI